MNFRRLIIAIAIIAVAASCKKDKDSAVTPSLEGYLTIKGLPEYISPETELSFEAHGVSHPDGGALGYAWSVVPGMETADTVNTPAFSYKFPANPGTYTLSCRVFADGYSGLSATSRTTIVKSGKNGSITGTEYPASYIITDKDTIYYKTIGSQTWTVNNISTGAGLPYKNLEVTANVFGRFYNYAEAVAACQSIQDPEGEWTLPSAGDWETLFSHIKSNRGDEYGKTMAAALMADADFNGVKMWEYWTAVGEIKNGSGFSAIPCGYANVSAKSFDGMYEYACFWTSTQSDANNRATYKYLIADQPEIFTGEADKTSYGASVRCIRK